MITRLRRKPAYLMISDTLRERMENGELEAGDRFPAERELIQDFGVARMTIRRALDVLQSEGLIDRRRGRTGGTFVRAVQPVIHLDRLAHVDTQLREYGGVVHTDVVDVDRRWAPRAIASFLNLDEDAEVWAIKRVRTYNGEPISFVCNHLPVRMFPEVTSADLSAPLYDNVVYKREAMTAVTPTFEIQDRLKVSRQQPLIRLVRVAWNEAGEPMDYVEEFIHTEVFGLENEAGIMPRGLEVHRPLR